MLYFRNLGCENRLKPKAGFGDFVYLQLRCGQPWGSPKGVLLPLGPLITRGTVEGREYMYIDCPKPRGDGKAGGNCAFRAIARQSLTLSTMKSQAENQPPLYCGLGRVVTP